MWGTVLKRDLLGETREEDRFHNKKELQEYLKSEIERQGKNVVIRNLDVSLVEDLSDLFYKITDVVESLDLSGWKTSNVNNMEGMFYKCSSLKSINLSDWDTSNLDNMNSMFWGCSNLESLDLSGWDTSNVGNMGHMFKECSSIGSLDLSGWRTSNVTNMNHTFYNCKSLESLDLSGWETSNVKDMSWIFWGCPAPYKVVNNVINNKIVRIK